MSRDNGETNAITPRGGGQRELTGEGGGEREGDSQKLDVFRCESERV